MTVGSRFTGRVVMGLNKDMEGIDLKRTFFANDLANLIDGSIIESGWSYGWGQKWNEKIGRIEKKEYEQFWKPHMEAKNYLGLYEIWND